MNMMFKFGSLIAGIMGFLCAQAGAQASVLPGAYTGIGIYQERQSFTGGNASTGASVGLLFGGVVDIPISQTTSFRPGIVLVSRGGGGEAFPIQTSEGTLLDSMTGALHYLTLPLDLKLKYPVAPDVTAYGLVGVNLGLLISAMGHVTTPGLGSADIDIASNYHSVDFGLEIGGGIEFQGKDYSPFIEASYYAGLTNTATFVPNSNDITNFSQTNGGLELRVGVNFKQGALRKIL